MKKGKILGFVFFSLAVLLVSSSFAVAFWPFDWLFGKTTGNAVATPTVPASPVAGYDSARGGIVCGQVYNITDISLVQDLFYTGTGPCITVDVPNAVVNCNGHSIKFRGKSESSDIQTGYGTINAPRAAVYTYQNGLTVKNCNFTGSTSGDYGVYIDGGKIANTGGNIINNTFTSLYTGIYAGKESKVIVNANKFNNNYMNIYLSENDVSEISNNVLGDSDDEDVGVTAYGIYLNSVKNNVIKENKFRNSFYGLYLSAGSSKNIVKDNVFDCAVDIVPATKTVSAANEFTNNLFSGAISFDGVKQYAYNSVTDLYAKPVSVSLWVRRDNLEVVGNNKIILNLFGNDAFFVLINGVDNKYHFRHEIGTKRTQIGDIILSDKVDYYWHNIIISISNTNPGYYNVFFDGKKIGEVKDDSAYGFTGYGNLGYGYSYRSDNSVFVGRTSNSTATNVGISFFKGSIDELRIYTQSLSNQDIAKIYASGRIANSSLPSNGLIGWYKMEESSGIVLNDSSGRKNNLFLVGSPKWTFGISQEDIVVTPPIVAPATGTGTGSGGSGGSGGGATSGGSGTSTTTNNDNTANTDTDDNTPKTEENKTITPEKPVVKSNWSIWLTVIIVILVLVIVAVVLLSLKHNEEKSAQPSEI